MVNLIDVEEINQIFENFEKLKKKSEGSDNSVEARVSNTSLWSGMGAIIGILANELTICFVPPCFRESR